MNWHNPEEELPHQDQTVIIYGSEKKHQQPQVLTGFMRRYNMKDCWWSHNTNNYVMVQPMEVVISWMPLPGAPHNQ